MKRGGWLTAERWALGGLLFGWLMPLRWKLATFAAYTSESLADDRFAPLLRRPETLWGVWLPTGLLLSVALLVASRRLRQVAAWVTVLASGMLMLHARTFAWQVFVTSFWSALWLGWLVSRPVADSRSGVAVRGRLLAQAVIGLVFLGAATGKWTDGYWSGAVMHDLMFVQHPAPQYAYLRGHLSAEQLRTLATWYSRAVVATESLFGLAPFIPARIALPGLIVGMLGMWLASAPGVIEVLAPLIGVAAAAHRLPTHDE